ncbi:hypothetical protein WMY93_022818 [Mugilogobius chulae]|uniref:Methyltransferase type 11 domain-containing protein n=1 Tax=Mugilogobius chulae TaxID=88201 RepID=A0AAW0NKA3_9GOBI
MLDQCLLPNIAKLWSNGALHIVVGLCNGLESGLNMTRVRTKHEPESEIKNLLNLPPRHFVTSKTPATCKKKRENEKERVSGAEPGACSPAESFQTHVRLNMAVRLFEEKHHASAYLKYRVTPHEMVRLIVRYAKQRMADPLELAVDVGCGSGQGTVLLAPHFTHVLGTDISPAQLENARANRQLPNVTYSLAPSEALPLDSGSVDLLTAMTAAHWFQSDLFLQEADRVLRPGGCLALFSYPIEFGVEYENVTLTHLCQEFYRAVSAYRHPRIGTKSVTFTRRCSSPARTRTKNGG